MKVIGLTGTIGSGKSTVLKYLNNLGYLTLQADDVIQCLYSKESRLIQKIKSKFPFLYSHGKIKKNLISSNIISNPNKMKILSDLEKIIHPYVMQKQREFAKAAKKLGTSLVFIEMPLIFEANLMKYYDLIITVYASKATCKTRLNIKTAKAKKLYNILVNRQLTGKAKIQKADYTINNNKNLRYLKKKVIFVLERIV